LPFITTIVKYDVKVIKEDSRMETYTKDIQTAKLQISVSYQLDKTDLYKVYSQFGKDWEEKIIWNNISQQVKDVIGKYDAENLIENRDKVAQTILATMNEKIAALPAELTQFQILNIDYNDEFERAVERKVVQSQRSQEEVHKTKQIEEESKQKVISAKAESEAMRIKAQALSQNKALVDYEAVLRWDGKLPQYVGGNSMPILNLK
jgi:regulator of protease activity HflC (stomatin/prohibitin superfamily)